MSPGPGMGLLALLESCSVSVLTTYILPWEEDHMLGVSTAMSRKGAGSQSWTLGLLGAWEISKPPYFRVCFKQPGLCGVIISTVSAGASATQCLPTYDTDIMLEKNPVAFFLNEDIKLEGQEKLRAVLYQVGGLALFFLHSCRIILDKSIDFLSNHVLCEALGRGDGADIMKFLLSLLGP